MSILSIFCKIPYRYYEGPSVHQAMLQLYKGVKKKDMDGRQMWRKYKDELNEFQKFV